MVFYGDKVIRATKVDQSEDGKLTAEFSDFLGYVISGRFYNIKTGAQDYLAKHSIQEPSLHFTYIFNILVLFQIFNFFSVRKINNDCFVFEGILASHTFLIIMATILAVQVCLVTFANAAFTVSEGGLHFQGWIVCLLISGSGMLVSSLLRCIPLEKLCCCYRKSTKKHQFGFKIPEKKPTEEEIGSRSH